MINKLTNQDETLKSVEEAKKLENEKRAAKKAEDLQRCDEIIESLMATILKATNKLREGDTTDSWTLIINKTEKQLQSSLSNLQRLDVPLIRIERDVLLRVNG